jgi:phosphoadenylyl-sulfate reductase (thioredoxin)
MDNTLASLIRTSRESIGKAYEKHLGRIAVFSSFSNIILPHLARSVAPDIPIVAFMTFYMPFETFEYFVAMDRRYGFNTTVYMVGGKFIGYLINKIGKERVVALPRKEFDLKYQEVKEATGQEIYDADPDECCRLLKLNPAKEAVKNLDAWISGLRNFDLPEIEDNRADGLIKYNPLIKWNETVLREYVNEYNIPDHPLYAKGYRSLGCAPCSRPTRPDEPERAGRWPGKGKKICSIHEDSMK